MLDNYTNCNCGFPKAQHFHCAFCLHEKDCHNRFKLENLEINNVKVIVRELNSITNRHIGNLYSEQTIPLIKNEINYFLSDFYKTDVSRLIKLDIETYSVYFTGHIRTNIINIKTNKRIVSYEQLNSILQGYSTPDCKTCNGYGMICSEVDVRTAGYLDSLCGTCNGKGFTDYGGISS